MGPLKLRKPMGPLLWRQPMGPLLRKPMGPLFQHRRILTPKVEAVGWPSVQLWTHRGQALLGVVAVGAAVLEFWSMSGGGCGRNCAAIWSVSWSTK